MVDIFYEFLCNIYAPNKQVTLHYKKEFCLHLQMANVCWWFYFSKFI